MSSPTTTTAIDVRYAATVLAVILPPLAIYLNTGDIKSTILNVVLCFGFYVPGIVHAVFKITKADPLNGKTAAAEEDKDT